MTRDDWLVAVGAGRWQVPGILAARRAGLKVMAVDGDKNALGFEHAHRSLVVDIRDASAVSAAIAGTGIRPEGAIAFCNEAGMSTTAIIREHFSLPCAGPHTTLMLTNKGTQRASWSKANVPGPNWRVVRSEAEVSPALQEIGGTVIFKPVDSAGSRGVSVIGPDESWENAFREAKKNSLAGEVIIEAFIVGVEHTVETFTHRGKTHILAVTSKRKVPGTHGTVASELETAQLSADVRSRVDSVVRQALAALGYTEGPGHTEFFLTSEGEIFLVESAGRGGGFMVADGIVPLMSGFDLSKACALQAVGSEPEIPESFLQKSVVLRFVPSQAGKVVSMVGFETEDEIPGVVCEPMVRVGQEVGRASNDGDRMAFVLAVAETLKEARTLADAREQRICISIK
jgi:biotin carboxylase